MPEVIDEEELKGEQKDAKASERAPVEVPDDDELAETIEPPESPQPQSRSVETSHDAESQTGKRPLYKRAAFLIAAIIVLVVGAAIGLHYYLYARSHESSDDAFIDGHIVQISPKASGYVVKVYVDDNQQVKAGDLIVELDARDYQVRLDQAKAALNAGLAKQNEARTNVSLTRATGAASVQQAMATVRQARSSVESSRAGAASLQSRASQASSAVSTAQANLEQARAAVLAAEAEATRSTADVNRYQLLFGKDEISKQQLDQAVAASHSASAQLESARQRVVAAMAQVNEA